MDDDEEDNAIDVGEFMDGGCVSEVTDVSLESDADVDGFDCLT